MRTRAAAVALALVLVVGGGVAAWATAGFVSVEETGTLEFLVNLTKG